MNLFVVICEDRHVDDWISVHGSRESADARIEEFKSRYTGERHEYVWFERGYGQPKWVRFVETDCDDGPSARIETMELIP